MPEFYYKINSRNGAKQNIFLSLLPEAGVHIHVIQLLYVVYPFLRRITLHGATPGVGAMAPGNEARTLTFINLNSKLPPNNTSLFLQQYLAYQNQVASRPSPVPTFLHTTNGCSFDKIRQFFARKDLSTSYI